MRSDVIIIGAGIAGVSLAAELAERCQVTLLEMAAAPATQATGRSAAYFAPAYGNAWIRELTRHSSDFFSQPPGDFSDTALLRHRPALFIGTASQRPSLTAMLEESLQLTKSPQPIKSHQPVESLQPVDSPQPELTFLEGASLQARVPVLNDSVQYGLLDERGGDIEVDALVQGYLRQFRNQKGVLATGAPVHTIKRQSGLWRVETAKGTYSANIIVNAAGAWADGIAQLAGVGPLGLVPNRRTAVLVDAPSGYEINDWPLVIDADEQFYFKPDAGQLLLSPADETPMPACDVQPDDEDVALGIYRVEQVADLGVKKVNHRWAGLRTFASDRTPVLGFDLRAEGFFWCAGQGGYGVQTSPAMAQTGRLLVEAGEGGPAGTDSELLNPALLQALSPERLF